MSAKVKKILIIVLVSILAAAAAGVGIYFAWENSAVYVNDVRISKDVTALNLQGKQVENVDALKKYKKLEKLNLTGVDVTNEQVAEIAEALPECQIVWDINLFGRKFNVSIKEMDLTGNKKVNLPELKEYLNYFPNLVSVDLTDCDFSDDELLEFAKSVEPQVVR